MTAAETWKIISEVAMFLVIACKMLMIKATNMLDYNTPVNAGHLIAHQIMSKEMIVNVT